MKLFTKEIDKNLFQQYPYGSDLDSQKVVAKIFNPYGKGTWYLLNSDPNDPDYIWAIVDLFEVEVGSVSRTELESIKVKPFGLGLERDLYFTPVNATELFEGLLSGKRYAEGGVSDVEVIEKNNEAYLSMPQVGKGSTMVKLEHGGNLDMLKNQAVQFKHHAEELHNVLKSNPDVHAWVVAKAERAATDLSDITHYLEGNKRMANGGQLAMFEQGGDILSEDTIARVDDPAFADLSMYAKGGSIENLYSKLITEYNKGGWEKIASFDRFLDVKKESALEKGNLELYNKLIDVQNMYEKDFYAKGGQIKNGSLVRVNKYGWIMRVDKIEGNMYYLENDKRGTMNGNAGSYLASDIELVMAKGGIIDHYKEFEINKDGYLSATINSSYYEIRYRDDVSQIYDLYKDGKLIKSSKDLRSLFKFSTSQRPMIVRGYSDDEMYEYAKGGEVKVGLGQPVSYRGELYEVTQKNGVTHLTLNKEGAWGSDYPSIPLSMVDQNELRNIYGEKVFIPYTFDKYAKGGGVDEVDESTLYEWAKNIDDENLLSWCGYKNKYDFEDSADLTYNKRNLILTNFEDLEYVYNNQAEYGLTNTGKVGDKEYKRVTSGELLDSYSEGSLGDRYVEVYNKNGQIYFVKYGKENDDEQNYGLLKLSKKEAIDKGWLDHKEKGGGIGEYAKGGIIGSSPTIEGINKLIGEYYYSPNIKLEKNTENSWNVLNSKGVINSVEVIEKKGKFYFKEKDKKYGKGGKTTFKDKVASIKAKLLKNKKVPKAVQKDYGKTFSPAEAEDSAKRIAGAMRKKEMAKK